jgi:hypothetical protein
VMRTTKPNLSNIVSQLFFKPCLTLALGPAIFRQSVST